MSSDIQVKISADSSKMKSGLGEAKAAAKEFAKDLKGEFATAFAIGALVEGVRNAIEHFGNIGDLAERFNVSATALQKLGFAGEQTGTSLESIARGLGKMRLAMSDAASKAGDARTVFEAVGISTAQLKDGSVGSEEAFYRVADAVKHASSENEQLSIATAVFGAKIAGELVPVLALGRDGLMEMGGQAATLSDDMVAMLKASDDSTKELKNTFTVAFGYIAIVFNGLVEVVRAVVTTIVSSWYSLGTATAKLGEAIYYGLTGRFGEAKRAFREMTDSIKAGIETTEDAWRELPDKLMKPKDEKKEEVAKRKILQTDDEKKAAEEKAKLQKDLAEQQLKIEESRMEAQERLNRLTERYTALMSEASKLEWDTNEGLQKRLEAAKLLEQVERERKSVDEKAKKDAEDLAKLKEQEANAIEANRSKGEKTDAKAQRLKSKEAQLRKEAESEPDEEKKAEKRIEAEKVRGELIDLALSKQKNFSAPTVDSLRAIGGGSGGVGPAADPALLEQRRGNSILMEIRDAVKSRNGDSNSSLTVGT